MHGGNKSCGSWHEIVPKQFNFIFLSDEQATYSCKVGFKVSTSEVEYSSICLFTRVPLDVRVDHRNM